MFQCTLQLFLATLFISAAMTTVCFAYGPGYRFGYGIGGYKFRPFGYGYAFGYGFPRYRFGYGGYWPRYRGYFR